MSPRRPGFDPRSAHVRFDVEKVALEKVFLRILQFFPVSIITPMFDTYLHLRVALTRRKKGRSL